MGRTKDGEVEVVIQYGEKVLRLVRVPVFVRLDIDDKLNDRKISFALDEEEAVFVRDFLTKFIEGRL